MNHRGGVRTGIAVHRLAGSVVIQHQDREDGREIRSVARRTRFQEEVLRRAGSPFLAIGCVENCGTDQLTRAN